VIDGKNYTRDVIILPDRVLDGWWRKESHQLYLEDLTEVFQVQSQPEILIIGTGYAGLMKIAVEVEEVELKGIKLITEPTKQACKTFNKIKDSERRVIAAFHLTC
jgi:hypothetical protein